MRDKKIVLKSTDENGMVSETTITNMKTDVKFGFSPDKVEYIGKVNLEDLKDEKEDEE